MGDEQVAEVVPALDTEEGGRWLFEANGAALEVAGRGDLRTAQALYEAMARALEASGDPLSDGPLAAVYHQLGRVCQLARDLRGAAAWYGKALAIEEAGGNWSGMADNYHQLGVLAQDRAAAR
jgi:hypothetical protein